jgi:hypothetical protein
MSTLSRVRKPDSTFTKLLYPYDNLSTIKIDQIEKKLDINNIEKDYTILSNLKTKYDNINEKEIENKYSKFLDWLKNDIENIISKNQLISTSNGGNIQQIPMYFKDLLFNVNHSDFILNDDIYKYLDVRRIKIYDNFNASAPTKNISYFSYDIAYYDWYIEKKINQQKLDINICKNNITNMSRRIFDLENENSSILKKLEEQIQLNNKLCDKSPNLEKEVSSLKQTNQDILKKLEEQIELNSKLCKRIFEMKEDKFKDETS